MQPQVIVSAEAEDERTAETVLFSTSLAVLACLRRGTEIPRYYSIYHTILFHAARQLGMPGPDELRPVTFSDAMLASLIGGSSVFMI